MLEHVFLTVKLGLGWVQLFIPVKLNPSFYLSPGGLTGVCKTELQL